MHWPNSSIYKTKPRFKVIIELLDRMAFTFREIFSSLLRPFLRLYICSADGMVYTVQCVSSACFLLFFLDSLFSLSSHRFHSFSPSFPLLTCHHSYPSIPPILHFNLSSFTFPPCSTFFVSCHWHSDSDALAVSLMQNPRHGFDFFYKELTLIYLSLLIIT